MGTAFVSYTNPSHARTAIREFDGANAAGQPIRLALVRSGPARNPFDTAVRPNRSLFDRIEEPATRNGGRARGRDQDRSRSPTTRRSNTTKPPPDGVDRYVPGARLSRSRSPQVRRSRDTSEREPRGRDGRRGGDRRGGDRRGGGGHAERTTNGGRSKKTQEELDQEM